MALAQGKIVVVTGGASGIGAACATTLAANGWHVVVADVNIAGARQVSARIGGEALELDVADDESVKHAALDVEKRIGPVFGLVNSAGIIQKPLNPYDLDMATWDRIQRVNFRGSYIVSLAFGRGMIAREAGSIVNIASITDSVSTPLHSYGPSKAAILSMTKCLAAEWGPSQIRVNSIAPGYTLTPALLDAIERGERDLKLLERNAALQRAVQPSQVGDAVEFLLSERALAITGIDLPVDCGWLVANPWNTYGGLRKAEVPANVDTSS
ncbi:SDR family NAD(P)-dependent oxidoreductase [Paralcaligenes ureilyticus]|uniref:NAD(P)-dependent dehydrogenase (Short-subunit alcohol dehydrogenase family) n=1 Tax=Paralcaligenes ureilyticus TaxID=627131 RepID=A0A4V2UZ91_9BURK|nr:SDR family oxidoreductase [Paralcaligenes ureilyticus]TCT10368.1 NAD(P)-dependent dehydrogenase (short-subunit alcohol dehydrogenase family) [Paralcaligenes ureilyticus]